MRKNELIEKLRSIKGNPVILLEGEGDGCILLKKAQLNKMHQSKYNTEEYITDSLYELGAGYNTFYHDNYREKTDECILLSLI